MTTTIMQRK